jgi:hypothetical protein
MREFLTLRLVRNNKEIIRTWQPLLHPSGSTVSTERQACAYPRRSAGSPSLFATYNRLKLAYSSDGCGYDDLVFELAIRQCGCKHDGFVVACAYARSLRLLQKVLATQRNFVGASVPGILGL